MHLLCARINTKAHFSALILQDEPFLSPLTADQRTRTQIITERDEEIEAESVILQFHREGDLFWIILLLKNYKLLQLLVISLLQSHASVDGQLRHRLSPKSLFWTLYHFAHNLYRRTPSPLSPLAPQTSMGTVGPGTGRHPNFLLFQPQP